MIFVDSSAWYAVFSRRDVNHVLATQAIRAFREHLITSDYVVDETITLLRARGEHRRALAFGRQLIESRWARLERIDERDFLGAWQIFKKFADKQWSFTDCTSLAVTERLGLNQAFAFDEHFRQFANVIVLP